MYVSDCVQKETVIEPMYIVNLCHFKNWCIV